MSWRVVVVSSNAKVDYKMDYLVVRTLEEVRRIHLSEVGVLVLESTAISITAYLLCELIRRKIKVIVCDHQRNPCAELVPVSGSHDSSAKIRQQLQWRKEVCQQIWTEIVREKLHRQRDHLLLPAKSDTPSGLPGLLYARGLCPTAAQSHPIPTGIGWT